VPTTLPYSINMFLNQVHRPLEILGAQSVLYCIINESIMFLTSNSG
jgi:hypothetical protein